MTPKEKNFIYVAYYIGKKGSKNFYTNTQRIVAHIDYNSLKFKEETIGKLKDFEIVLYIPKGNLTKYINENCVFWVKTSPNINKDNFDYCVVEIGQETKDFIIVYCKSVTTQNFSIFYCNDNKNILEFKIPYDKKSKTAVVKKNIYIPFNNDSLIWTKSPTSVEDTQNKIVYQYKENKDNCFILHFA